MAREHLGLHAHDLFKLRFQNRRYAAMQKVSTATEQGTIDGILHERVLESVFGIRRCSALEYQFGAHKLLQGIIHLMLRHLRNGTDQLV
jgi:hypothetical protein